MPRFLPLLAAAALAAATAHAEAADLPPPAPAASAPCGTVIVPAGVGMNTTPAPVPTMHPVLNSGSLYETEAIELLYRPLVWVNGDVAIDPTESLASGIAVNPDRTVFTVRLKPWHWSDGSRVTAADVVYDWDLMRALGAAYSDYLTGGIPNDIASITAPSPDTVVFTTKRPVNSEWFELSGISQFYPIPKQVWGRYTLARQQTLQSEAWFYRVVDGPFRLQSISLGRHAVFVPNPRYDGHRSSVARFVMDFLGGTDPLESLQGGQLDMATLPFSLTKAASEIPGFHRVTRGEAPLLYSIIPNLANPSVGFLDDVRVRQAIARAIDQRRMIDVVFHGHAIVQHGFVPSTMTPFLSPALRAGHDPLSYDPAAADALLDAAGYRPGRDGIREKDGHALRFSVLVTADAEERLLMLQLVQADLARVGIAITIKQVEFNQLVARMLGPPAGWEATVLGWTILTYPDPTSWFASGSTGNYEHYSDPEMDRLLTVATSSPGRDALFRLEDYALEQQPMIFLPDGTYTELVRNGIDGVDRFLSTNGNWTPNYLTLSGPMACHAPHA